MQTFYKKIMFVEVKMLIKLIQAKNILYDLMYGLIFKNSITSKKP